MISVAVLPETQDMESFQSLLTRSDKRAHSCNKSASQEWKSP